MNRMTELLERINYDLPGLKKAKMCYAQGDADGAMDAVIEHFCTRTTPKYLFTAKEMEQCNIAANVEATLRDMETSTPVEEGRPVHFPGAHMAEVRSDNMENGIPVEDAIWQQVLAL